MESLMSSSQKKNESHSSPKMGDIQARGVVCLKIPFCLFRFHCFMLSTAHLELISYRKKWGTCCIYVTWLIAWRDPPSLSLTLTLTHSRYRKGNLLDLWTGVRLGGND